MGTINLKWDPFWVTKVYLPVILKQQKNSRARLGEHQRQKFGSFIENGCKQTINEGSLQCRNMLHVHSIMLDVHQKSLPRSRRVKPFGHLVIKYWNDVV